MYAHVIMMRPDTMWSFLLRNSMLRPERIGLRGVNSTRNAWGYLAPGDEAIVSDHPRTLSALG